MQMLQMQQWQAAIATASGATMNATPAILGWRAATSAVQ